MEMTFKKLIEKYLTSSKVEKMEHLTDKIDRFVEEVKINNKELAHEFLMKVDLLLNPNFTKETAKYAVSRMMNKDGSKGEHWDYETTSKVVELKNLNFEKADFYYVLNLIYSDYYKPNRSDDTYIELACDFLCDIDAPEDKAKRYYISMK